MRKEVLECVNRLTFTLAVEVSAPPRGTRDILVALRVWRSQEGSAIWPRVKTLTIGFGSPPPTNHFNTLREPELEDRTARFPWQALRDLLTCSAVATGDLRMRLRTPLQGPGLPRYNDISAKDVQKALCAF